MLAIFSRAACENKLILKKHFKKKGLLNIIYVQSMEIEYYSGIFKIIDIPV